MSEIAFVLDASALARKFYDDLGKTNLDKIFTQLDASFFIPEIGIIETVSALLAACNGGQISLEEYKAAVSVLYKMIEGEDIHVLSPPNNYVKDCISILEQYKRIPGKSFNGVDAIYISLSRSIADNLAPDGISVIFVTSDTKLYNACQEETSFKTFHFWTCNLGCGHTNFIPQKGAKNKAAKYVKCHECKSDVIVTPQVPTPNRCPICGQSCSDCNLKACPSTYEVNLEVTP